MVDRLSGKLSSSKNQGWLSFTARALNIIREAATKMVESPPSSPSSLMAAGTIILFYLSPKITGFWQLFFSKNVWTKRAILFGKCCNKPIKKNTDQQTLTWYVHMLISCLKGRVHQFWHCNIKWCPSIVQQILEGLRIWSPLTRVIIFFKRPRKQPVPSGPFLGSIFPLTRNVVIISIPFSL